jgi:hypothetical protein
MESDEVMWKSGAGGASPREKNSPMMEFSGEEQMSKTWNEAPWPCKRL